MSRRTKVLGGATLALGLVSLVSAQACMGRGMYTRPEVTGGMDCAASTEQLDHRVVLIGDTGQHDAEIYRSVVGDNPDRVELVLLRDVVGTARADEVRELFADVDVPAVVAATSTEFAATCEELGLVPSGWTDRVATGP